MASPWRDCLLGSDHLHTSHPGAYPDNYEKAKSYFESIKDKMSEESDFMFSMGIIELKNENYEENLLDFQFIVSVIHCLEQLFFQKDQQ